MFVGRSAERGELAARLTAAGSGRGGVVAVVGEAGIGKSALVERVLADAAVAGMRTLTGRCSADDGTPDFWPWHQVLVRGGFAEQMLDQPAASGVTAAAAQFAVVRRVTEALVAAAVRGPVVVALDDVQWADDACIALLRQLATDAAGAPILLIVTVRDPDPQRTAPLALDAFLSTSDVEVLRLTPLAEPAVEAFLRATAGPDLDLRWVPELHRRTGGNPLFLREMTRMLGGGDLTGAPTGPALPAELRRLLAIRIGQTSSACQTAIGAASAIGDEFDVDAVTAVVPDAAPALPEAVAAGLLTEDASAPQRLRFSHGLIREARYALLDRPERLRLHRRLAEHAQDPGDRARHLVRAVVDVGSARTALTACRTAAAAALRTGGVDAADYWLGQAGGLAAAAALSEPDRARLLVAHGQVQYRLGQVSTALEHASAALEIAERLGDGDLAADAALTVHDVGGEPAIAIAALCARALAFTASPGRHARVLAAQANALSEAGDDVRARQSAAAAMTIASELAERAGHADTEAASALIDALHARHTTIAGLHRLTEVLDLGKRVRELAPIAGRPDVVVWSFQWRVEAYLRLGAIAETDREITEFAGAVRRLDWPMARWHLARVRAAVAVRNGDFKTAREYADEARRIGSGTQDVSSEYLYIAFIDNLDWITGRGSDTRDLAQMWADAGRMSLPLIDALHGATMAVVGRTDEAARALARLRPVLGSIPIDQRAAVTYLAAGELAAHLGDAETARTAYALGLPSRGLFVNSGSGVRGSASRSLGMMAAAFGDLDTADLLLNEAVAMEDRIGSLPFLALACLEHARALSIRGASGDRDRALSRCDQAMRTARQVGADRIATEAAALAGELTGVSAGPAALTAREREIAGLVAEGLPNRIIAERLVLSERTVESHVRAALAKIGAENRTQLAAWAVRAGLRPQ